MPLGSTQSDLCYTISTNAGGIGLTGGSRMTKIKILVQFECPNPDGCMLKETVDRVDLPYHCLCCAHEDLGTVATFI